MRFMLFEVTYSFIYVISYGLGNKYVLHWKLILIFVIVSLVLIYYENQEWAGLPLS